MPDGEHLDSVPARRYPIQSNVSGPTVRDGQLAQPPPDWTADVWMPFEDPDCVDDEFRCADRGGGIHGHEEIEQPIEIGQGPRTVGNRGQRRLASRAR